MVLLYGIVSDSIIASFSPLHIVSGLIIYGDRVIYCGERDFVIKFIDRFGGELIDYGSYTILPGFHDPHLHLSALAVWDNIVDLSRAGSIEELVGIVKNALMKKNTVWIIGRGWDHMRFREKRMPTIKDLDRLDTGKPILLIRVCGHVAVANKSALEKIDGKMKNIDWNNGLLYEESVEHLWRKALEEIGLESRSYIGALDKLYRHGIVGIGWMSASLNEVVAYHSIKTLKPYTRIYLEPKSFMEWIKYGLPIETLDIHGIKIVLDGSLGAHTAYLSKPYNDKPDSHGKLNMDLKELEKYILIARRKQFHIAIHAIGDRALDIILQLYYIHRLKGERIEHASLVRNDQIELMKSLGPRIALQPGFILSDKWLVERIGRNRLAWAYRIASLSRITKVGFSSDAPVEPIDPWRNIYASITRGEYEGLDIRATTEEKIDLLTALYLHTNGSAEVLYYSDKGCLTQGYSADYIVVDKNPLIINDPRELLKIKVIETRIAGQKVYP